MSPLLKLAATARRRRLARLERDVDHTNDSCCVTSIKISLRKYRLKWNNRHSSNEYPSGCGRCEGLFAEAKQNHCLARAKYRGRAKVQIQAYLCAIVQNLKRLLFPLYCWLVAACLRFMHRAAHRQSANSTPPNSTHQMTAESILFQHARWFNGASGGKNLAKTLFRENGLRVVENRRVGQNRSLSGVSRVRGRQVLIPQFGRLQYEPVIYCH